MKHEQLWMACAAAGITVAILGGAATAALAKQQSPVTTVVGERTGDRSVRVSYRDLNLAAASDERILKRRVGSAARMVCEPENGYIDIHTFAACASFAWKGARPQIALAVRRAHDIAATGSSSIPLVAISIVAAQ